MSTRLGNNAKPTATQESSTVNNQQGHVLTLPAGGPWNITHGGGWLAGLVDDVTAKICLWAADGTLLAESGSFVAAGQPFAVGQCTSYEVSNGSGTFPVEVAGGASVYFGWWTTNGDGVQFGRYATPGAHIDDSVGAAPENLNGVVDNGGDISAWLYYEASNAAPGAPTLGDPTGGELVASQTPTLSFTPSDPDEDDHTGYTYQVDNNSDFSSPVESIEVNGTFPDHTLIQRVVSATLTRGTTYWWRVKTKDATNGYGPYSAGASFKVAQLPTATLTAPGSAQVAELYYTAGSNTTPKVMARWTYNCPDGHAQNQAIIKIYADSAGSPGSLLNTDTYNGSNAFFQTTYAVTEGTYYHVSVQPRCSLNVQGAESTKHRCRTRWARASYYFDSGSTPTTLSVSSVDTTVSGNQSIVMEYTATGSSSEPGTWYASVASAGLQRFFWHRATMFAWGASPTSPKLNSLTWSYSANALTLDHWTMASGASVDVGTFVYGSQSLKHATNGAEQSTHQTFPVTANTPIILSGKIRALGQPNAQLRLMDAAGTTVLASVTATADTDWTRYTTAPINTGSATSMRCSLRTNATAGATAWFDIEKVEASTVVTPWTPGFLGAVKLDAGGMIVDAQQGGILRLRASTGGTRDQVDLGANGLRFGGGTSPVNLYSPSADLLEVDDDLKVAGGDLYIGADTRLIAAGSEVLQVRDAGGAALSGAFDLDSTKLRWGGASFPGSPSTDDLFYRDDRDLLYFYDGTRWLSVSLYHMLIPISRTTNPLSVTFSAHESFIPNEQYDVWVEEFIASFVVSGGTALSGSHKWVLTLERHGSVTTMSTINIDSGASDSRRRLTASVGALTGTSDSSFTITSTKTGTPGDLYLWPGIRYRVVG